MIKGVNRQIIEVTDTGNIYYERAILFVRPEYRSSSYEKLNSEASDLVKKYKAPSAINSGKMIFSHILRLLISAGIGSILTIILLSLFEVRL